MTRARLTGEPLADSEDWLVRKDGSILRIAYSSAPFDLPDGPRVGDRVHRRRGAPARRAGGARARRRRARAAELRARAGASSRPRTPRARGSSATCTTAPSSSSSTSRCGCGSRAASCPTDPERAREAARRRASSWRRPRRASCASSPPGIHPAILTHRGLGPAVQRLASRMPLPVRVLETPDGRLPAPVEASVYFVVSEALTNVVKHARRSEATRAHRGRRRLADRRGRRRRRGRGAGRRGGTGCAAWPTASPRSTGRSRSRARPAAGRCCAPASRWRADKRPPSRAQADRCSLPADRPPRFSYRLAQTGAPSQPLSSGRKRVVLQAIRARPAAAMPPCEPGLRGRAKPESPRFNVCPAVKGLPSRPSGGGRGVATA